MDIAQLLSDLVAIPSVNPMGRALEGPEFFEGRMTAYLEDFFRTLGVPFRRQRVREGRDNIVACVEAPGREGLGSRAQGSAGLAVQGPGRRRRPIVMLEAHQDTVPTDGMVIEPFKPVIKNGRVYGRGACDIKGGMAAMLAALARIARERPENAPHVVMACTVDEEFTFTGVQKLPELWEGSPARGVESSGAASLLAMRPDMAIVAEPTDLDIVVAHKGAVRWKIRTTGRACHSSRPQEGINAIYRMMRVVAALEEYAAHVGDRIPPHPLCGRATLSVGRIEGGLSANTVPDWCTIEIDRRLLPGEDGMQVRAGIERFVRERVDFDFDMLEPWMRGVTLADDSNGEVAERLGRAVDEVRGRHAKIGVPYGTDAAKLAAAGVPSVVFGPGSISQAHTNDEWVSLDEVETASEILYRFLRSWTS